MELLPPHWSWVKLGDVCTTTSGGTPSRGISEYYNGTIPWVKSGELDKGLILDTEEKISDEALKNSSAKLFPKGTLLIALYGATIGKLAFLGVEAATNQAVCGIYKNENIDSNFLFNFLFFKKRYLVKQSIGGAQPNISQGILKNLEIPLPPLPEQKKIVEKIEELFSGLDSGVASLKKAKEQIRLYRQSVLSDAFSGRLTQEAGGKKQGYLNGVKVAPKAAEPKVDYANELPEGWKWVQLGEVCKKITDGTHKTPKYVSQGIEFISVKDIYSDKIHFDNCKYITLEEHKELIKRCNPEKGDVLITKSGTIGRTAVVDIDNEFSLFVSVALLKNNSEILNSKYLKFSLDNYINKTNIDQFIKGGLLKNFHIEDIKATKIPFPSINQQTQIVEEIEKRFSEADNLEKAIDDSLTKSEMLRQSILKQAFEGRLI